MSLPRLSSDFFYLLPSSYMRHTCLSKSELDPRFALLCWWSTNPLTNRPLLPMHLCKNRDWLVLILIWSIGASVYYAFALIWPSMVLGLYADGQIMWAGWASGVVGAGITLGEILAGFTKKRAH